jgi:hypothetical protein
MSEKRALTRFLAALAVLMLLSAGYGLIHPARSRGRSQRINGVNIVRSVSIALSNTNAPAAAQTTGQK